MLQAPKFYYFFLLKPTNSRLNKAEFSLFLAPNPLRGRPVTLSVICPQGIVTPATITAKRLKIFKLNYGCLVVFNVKSEEVNPTKSFARNTNHFKPFNPGQVIRGVWQEARCCCTCWNVNNRMPQFRSILQSLGGRHIKPVTNLKNVMYYCVLIYGIK